MDAAQKDDSAVAVAVAGTVAEAVAAAAAAAAKPGRLAILCRRCGARRGELRREFGGPGAATRGPLWIKFECVIVCKAVLVVGQNPIIGTDQNKESLWQAVGDMLRGALLRRADTVRLGGNARRTERTERAIKREFQDKIRKCV